MLELLQEKPRVKSAVSSIYRRYPRKQVRYNACEMRFIQVSWNYKDEILTNIQVPFENLNNFKIPELLTPSQPRPWRRRRGLTESFRCAFRKISWKTYVSIPGILQKIIMTRYKHLTLTTTMPINCCLWFMFLYVFINVFRFPLHLTFAKYLYMWLRLS